MARPEFNQRIVAPLTAASSDAKRDERDAFLRNVVDELRHENIRWPGLWTRLDSLLKENERLRGRGHDCVCRGWPGYVESECRCGTYVDRHGVWCANDNCRALLARPEGATP